MTVRDDILALTENANLQSDECYQIAKFAANIADDGLEKEVGDRMYLVKREIYRLRKVQAMITAFGLIDEGMLKNVSDIVASVGESKDNSDDPDMDTVLKERDHWEAKATELAEDYGEAVGIDVGEHSNTNCPVQNAIDNLSELGPGELKR